MGFLDGLFGGNKNNPAQAAMPYLSQIPGEANQYLQPYYQYGTAALPALQQQYAGMLSNPGQSLNQFGQSYQQSPGFQSALKNALTAGSHAAAAGGMAGTPQNQFQEMEMATNLANQDYYNWLDRTLNLHSQGLQGAQGLAGMGAGAGQNMADTIAQTLASQAGYSYAGQAAKNQQNSGLLSGLAKGAGALSAFTPWGGTGSAFETAYNRMFK